MRVLALVVSALALFVIVGLVAWMYGQSTTKSNPNFYPVTGNSNTVPDAEFETAVKTGTLAPDFELSDVRTGKPVKLSSFRGKPTWVNFWASWCPPCKAELPDMKVRFERYKDKGLVLVGIDMGEDNETVKQFTKLNAYDWAFVIDKGQAVTNRYFVSGIPTHVFIGKDGVIKSMQVGSISSEMMDQELAKIVGQ